MLANMPDLSQAKALQYLSVKFNLIRHLPDSLCHLSELQVLDVANNQICELPRAI